MKPIEEIRKDGLENAKKIFRLAGLPFDQEAADVLVRGYVIKHMDECQSASKYEILRARHFKGAA